MRVPFISSLAKGAAGGAASGGLSGPAAAVIGAGIGAVSSIFGAKKQSSAVKEAAQTESKYTAEALADARAEREYQRQMEDRARNDALETRDYSRGQYRDYVGRLSPFATAGTQAVNRLSKNLAGQLPSAVPSNSNEMVQLADKHGRIRAVPASHAERYIAMGARKV